MQHAPEIERVSLAGLAFNILRSWWLILAASVLGVLLALIFVSRIQPTYQARMIVGPQQNLASGGRAPSTGTGLGSLLSGLSTASNGDIPKVEIMLKSDRLARLIWEDKALLREIFPGNWNTATQSWRPRNSGFGPWLLSLIGVTLPAEPTPNDVQVKLASRLTVKPEQQIYRNFTFTAQSPREAQDILQRVVVLADKTLREDDHRRLDRMITYTDTRLKESTVQAQVQALTALLLSLEQQRMLALSSAYYTFDMIQDSQADGLPISPRPLVALASGLVLPPFLVIAYLFLVPTRRRSI